MKAADSNDLHTQPKTFLGSFQEATGYSDWVIAVLIDIRGFSSFSKEADSIEVGHYIKTVYARIISRFFSYATYVKSTGDGLLVIVPYTEDTLALELGRIIKSSISLVDKFGEIGKGDANITFRTPQNLGIGISRGAVCRIANEDEILDYSGKVINFAARLCNLARPRGVILDLNCITSKTKRQISSHFVEDEVFIRGIAETESVKILTQKDLVVIDSEHRKPFAKDFWRDVVITKRFKDLKLFPTFQVQLPSAVSKENVLVRVHFPKYVNGRKISSAEAYIEFNYEVVTEAGATHVIVNYKDIVAKIEKFKIKDNDTVRMRHIYKATKPLDAQALQAKSRSKS